MSEERNAALDRLLSEAGPAIAAHWESCHAAGLSTPEATGQVDACLASFFARLKALPAGSAEPAVLAELKRLYAALDEVNASAGDGLLETDERELLVPLIVSAAEVMGVDPDAHDGEPGGEYRNF